ncbi:uncharacterized protein LOC144026780 isoform X2 [Festucalex cinctus]
MTKDSPTPPCFPLPQLLSCGRHSSRLGTGTAPTIRTIAKKRAAQLSFIKTKHLAAASTSLQILFHFSSSVLEASARVFPPMVLCGEGDCSVCLLAFSRAERVPRLLHCRHAFCQACLEAMAARSAGGGPSLCVRCPLCRRVTCVRRGLSLREALWVDSALWERIPSDQEDQDEEEEEDDREEAPQAERNKLKFGSFFRKFTLTKRPREQIVPSSNVEMKSWRRLSSEETL